MGELVCVVGVPVPPELDVFSNFKALWVGGGTAVLAGLDVVAGGKGAPGAREDDDADSGVGVGLINGQADLTLPSRR